MSNLTIRKPERLNLKSITVNPVYGNKNKPSRISKTAWETSKKARFSTNFFKESKEFRIKNNRVSFLEKKDRLDFKYAKVESYHLITNKFINFRGFLVSNEFDELLQELKDSLDILELEEGWDGYDAQPVSVEIYNSAVGFVIKYFDYLKENTGVKIETPEINAGINGNVILSWRTNNARLAISIEMVQGEVIGVYYGDLLSNKQPIKGSVPSNKVIDYLACWMKNLK